MTAHTKYLIVELILITIAVPKHDAEGPPLFLFTFSQLHSPQPLDSRLQQPARLELFA